MKRRLLNFAAVASAVIGVVTLVLWMHSLRHTNQITWCRGRWECWALLMDSRLALEQGWKRDGGNPQGLTYRRSMWATDVTMTVENGIKHWEMLGHSFLYSSSASGRGVAWFIPLWQLFVASLPLPAWQCITMWRRRHEFGPGRCRACGYDLRGSPERCPECGRKAVAGAHAS